MHDVGMYRAAILFLLTLSGCLQIAAEVAFHGAASAIGQTDEDQERRAEAEANADAEAKRQNENAQIRATGARLRRERDLAEAVEARGDGRVADDTPSRLDSTMILAAVAIVKPDVVACRADPSVKGNILVAVTVAPEGNVLSVTVKSTPDPVLGDCVGTALSHATFPATTRGGSFRYPVVF